jgi:two-component system, sporulation sensor kinase E
LIMLTGYADKENTIKAINELSLYYYIEKPWDNDELLLVIKNGIEKGNLIEELRNKMQELESAYVQLEETQDELIKKEKFSTIGNMASKIIHDLKNPMSAISGFAELIIKTSKEKKDDETYKEIREFAQIIMDEVKRVIGMITEVLQFAKGEEVYRKAALPLTDIIQDTVSAISDKFEKDNIQIELEIASNKSTMEIDHDKIMRMMYNLLNNSRDAMPDGGKIKIRVERVNKDTLLLSISDNGKGMPEDIRSSIFEPFISYGKPNGTGLGMPIVKKIVEAHKGHIYVESVEGKGTTVDIYFKTPYTDAIQKEEVTELNKE